MEKENDKIILKKIVIDMVFLAFIILYLGILYIFGKRLNNALFLNILKTTSIIVLIIGIIFAEFSYYKKSFKISINSAEIIFLAIYILISDVIIKRINITYNVFSILSIFIFLLYYLFKISIIYTNEKRKFANSFSDIHEILNNDPIKKEAQKRGEN